MAPIASKATLTEAINLTIDPDVVRMLVLKVREFLGKESNDIPDDGSNFTDDQMPAIAFQDDPQDLTEQEVRDYIRGRSETEQAELVALMWLGRDDAADSGEWRALVEQAVERRESPTEEYLLRNPLLGDYWLDGLEKLGLGGLDQPMNTSGLPGL
jgi:chemotaxis regulatin CheY-phosphate phosphatase CheZ